MWCVSLICNSVICSKLFAHGNIYLTNICFKVTFSRFRIPIFWQFWSVSRLPDRFHENAGKISFVKSQLFAFKPMFPGRFKFGTTWFAH